jgi:hypothetical protein
MIEANCPNVIRSFVPTSERDTISDDLEYTMGGGGGVMEDRGHTDVRVGLKGYMLTTISSLPLLLGSGIHDTDVLSSPSPWVKHSWQ